MINTKTPTTVAEIPAITCALNADVNSNILNATAIMIYSPVKTMNE